MVGELKWGSVVAGLLERSPFAEDSVAPRRYALLLARVVVVRPNIVFVCRGEGDFRFIVVAESVASAHLQLQLVVIIQAFEVADVKQLRHMFVGEADAIVEVAKPDDGIVVVDGTISLKA